MSRQPALIRLSAVVATALAEDLGTGWSVDDDLTSAATVPRDIRATAHFVPREAGVVAGLDAITETYAQVDPEVTVTRYAGDGDEVVPGETIVTIHGRARSVLAGERTALNLVTHLSGIATTTRELVDAVAGTGAIVRDTRKTLPGLRLVQKQAVLAGSGANHRMSLVDELLVKDNHVAAAGGMATAARGALSAARGLPVQIEVDSLEQLDVVLEAGADRVMLDNFSIEDSVEGVRRCRATGRKVFVEASGGITLETIAEIARTGVDSIAVGALTHSSGALDIGLDIHLDLPPGGEG
ncbi:carboxylating nicotinate-nucleotide diphosphorylase [Euzebya tangerina]|uniref:carboxylating nicotinate-nucleotide diphosphorylase n=1 Tax=Euzebya tangerina TaxID=591198 RepID=UPI00196AB339|nr:carboxylating nicotinate-nucleotide diphosphorylase [Euzebya tangerina]